DDVLALAARIADRRDGGRRILQQFLAEGGIGPGLGDDARAVVRANLLLIGLDQQIERSRLDIALLGQDRFERAHADLHLGQFRAVIVVVMMTMIVMVMIVVIVRHSWL